MKVKRKKGKIEHSVSADSGCFCYCCCYFIFSRLWNLAFIVNFDLLYMPHTGLEPYSLTSLLKDGELSWFDINPESHPSGCWHYTAKLKLPNGQNTFDNHFLWYKERYRFSEVFVRRTALISDITDISISDVLQVFFALKCFKVGYRYYSSQKGYKGGYSFKKIWCWKRMCLKLRRQVPSQNLVKCPSPVVANPRTSRNLHLI